MKKIAVLLLFPLVVLAQKKPLTLQAIYKSDTFKEETIRGFRSMSDGRFYTESNAKGLLKKNFVTGETVDTIVRAGDAKDENGAPLPLDDYEWCPGEGKLLLFKSREKIYRRSRKAYTYVYDLATKTTTLVDPEKVLHATCSPDAGKVAFVKGNNLYYHDLAAYTTIRVTRDGEWNKVINGNADWVYEEELQVSKAFAWSKNGTWLAYYRFDESNVPAYSFPVYDSLYPHEYSYKYPKAGEPNSVVQVHIYNVATGKDVVADIGADTDIYIPRIRWSQADDKLGIEWMNRLQNHVKWLMADAATGATKTFYDETNKYYIEINDNFRFLADGKRFINTSEKDGYRHIYINQIGEAGATRLTTGNYDVENIAGIDERQQLVYFTAAVTAPMDRQLYAVNYNKKISVRQVSQRAGTHRIDMNADLTYYVDTYSDINTPPVIAIYNTAGKLVKPLNSNAALTRRLQDYNLGEVTFIRVPNSKGDTLNGWMLKPSGFDPARRYPLLFCNYGGPGSQQVTNTWNKVSFWHRYLAQQGYIVVSVDNTGTGFRGAEFKKKTYLRLGQLEIEDQVDAAHYLGTLPYIDPQRIGHWGWSFGGFMSCLAITKGAGVFKTAIAVAPVTSWRYYDNIYTERFMRTPRDNAAGYELTSPLNFADSIRGKFLIIHGTADDNVHFQNSAMMVSKMTDHNIRFESAYYPNKNHGISGGNTTLHIYTLMTNFILNNL